jgi:hypothetical protein
MHYHRRYRPHHPPPREIGQGPICLMLVLLPPQEALFTSPRPPMVDRIIACLLSAACPHPSQAKSQSSLSAIEPRETTSHHWGRAGFAQPERGERGRERKTSRWSDLATPVRPSEPHGSAFPFWFRNISVLPNCNFAPMVSSCSYIVHAFLLKRCISFVKVKCVYY